MPPPWFGRRCGGGSGGGSGGKSGGGSGGGGEDGDGRLNLPEEGSISQRPNGLEEFGQNSES